MNALLIGTLLVCTVLLIAALILIQKRSVSPLAGALAVVQEAGVTALLGFLCMGLAYFLLAAKFYQPDMAGTGAKSYWFIALFALVCTLVGVFTLLYTYVKKGVAYPDRLMLVSALGSVKEMDWHEVQQVKVPMLSRRVTFKTQGGSYTVYGDPKQYRAFITAIQGRVPPEVGGDTLRDLLGRL